MSKFLLVAGVDEAGRGPLAGPVVAAAVILDPENPIDGLDDSKKLSPKRRAVLEQTIRDQALAWSVGRAEAEEIDRYNILNATLLAMRRAVLALPVMPHRVQVDGKHCPRLSCAAEAVVDGDSLVPAISAASILAKVSRDAEMVELDGRFPLYGFSRHKGYPTQAHIQSLQQYGACPVHRRSFGPVKRLLGNDGRGTGR